MSLVPTKPLTLSVLVGQSWKAPEASHSHDHREAGESEDPVFRAPRVEARELLELRKTEESHVRRSRH